MIIKINGVPIDSKYVSGWKDIFSIEKQIGKDVDADDFKIKIFGQTANTVLNDIINAADPRSANLIISFESKGRIITGKLSANGLSFCSDESCEVELNVDVNNEVKESIRNLKNINIWDTIGNGFISQGVNERRFPIYFPYCENRKLFELILSPFIVIYLWPTLAIVSVIIELWNALMNVLPFGIGDDYKIDVDGRPDTNTFQAMASIIDGIRRSMRGCGRKHKAVFIESYLANIAKLSGLSFKSNIFEAGGFMHNVVRLDAPRKKGGYDGNDIDESFVNNRPNLNGLQFLEELSQQLEIKYVVRNNTLFVDPIHLLLTSSNEEIEGGCFEFLKTPQYRLVAYEYTEDYADRYNPEVNKLYGGLVSFFPNLKGINKRLINYGMSQFRFDLFADDLVPIDDVTQNYPIAGDFINQKNFSNVLLLHDGLAALPRLLDWDGVSVNEAKVKRRKVTSILWLYNELFSLTTTGLFPGQKNLQSEIFSYVDGVFNNNLEWSKTLDIDCNRKEYEIYDVIMVNYRGQKKQALISYIKYNYESSTVDLKAKIFN